jgi:NAD(P)-dependent dehydrogenase (short-subunit alcohol dehydrogenase family)
MADSPTLMGVRVLVVGASAGIGRAFARHAVALGAQVCVSARRQDKLVELCQEAGGGHPIAGDMRVPEDCGRVVNEAAERLGGIDLVLYTAGSGTLAPIAVADPEAWRHEYEVNVIGPTLVCAAALPVLAPDGLISFMSSEAASETRWGLSSYSASKSALDTAIRFWRHEHPDRRFQRVVMGATMPTEFGVGFGAELLDTAIDHWMASGVAMTVMETDDVGRQLAEVLGVILSHPGIDVPDLYLDPRGQAWA